MHVHSYMHRHIYIFLYIYTWGENSWLEVFSIYCCLRARSRPSALSLYRRLDSAKKHYSKGPRDYLVSKLVVRITPLKLRGLITNLNPTSQVP